MKILDLCVLRTVISLEDNDSNSPTSQPSTPPQFPTDQQISDQTKQACEYCLLKFFRSTKNNSSNTLLFSAMPERYQGRMSMILKKYEDESINFGRYNSGLVKL